MAVAKHYEAQLQVVAEGTHETYNDLLVCVGGRVGDVSAGAPPDAGASEWWQKPKYKAVLNEQDSAATTVQAAFRGQRDRRLVADRPPQPLDGSPNSDRSPSKSHVLRGKDGELEAVFTMEGKLGLSFNSHIDDANGMEERIVVTANNAPDRKAAAQIKPGQVRVQRA